MPEVSRIEWVVCSENGTALEWFDDKLRAKEYAQKQDYQCYVEKRTEYMTDKEIIWATNKSMLDIEEE